MRNFNLQTIISQKRSYIIFHCEEFKISSCLDPFYHMLLISISTGHTPEQLALTL